MTREDSTSTFVRGIAITVRYAGPTTYRGARWIARADHPEGRVVFDYDHGQSTGLENAQQAAEALVAKWNKTRADEAAEEGAAGSPWFWTILGGGHTVDGYAFIATLSPACPFDGTSAAECSTVRERSVAGIANDVPGCLVHGRYTADDVETVR